MQPHRVISQKHAIFDDKLLGKGSTGNVYLGHELQPPYRQLAIKAIDLKKIDNEVTKYLLGCQITALTELSRLQVPGHENIVKLYDVVPQGDHIYLVTELLEGGTLAEHIKMHPNGLSQDESLHFMRQMLEGYIHIADKSIVHRDIKPDNILFRRRADPNKSIAIIDFGYCEMQEVANKPQVYYNVGSPKYMAPEAYKHNIYSEKSDIWALGVILYQMLIGKTCDEGHTMESYLQMIKIKGIPLPQNLSPFIKQLLSGMLCQSPKNRYSCYQALNQVKKHQQSTTFQKIQQSQIIVQASMPPQLKNNPTFQSTVISPLNVEPPIQQMINSQFLGTQNERKVPRHKFCQTPKSDKKLIKSRSANIIPIVTFKSDKAQVQNTLQKVQNVHINLTEGVLDKKDKTLQKPFHHHHPKPRVEQVSPKGLQVRHPSPCRIHFRFITQTANTQPKQHPEGTILQPQNHQYNEINFIKQENQRQARVITQPRPEPSDENSIRIFFRQNNTSPQVDSKLIGPIKQRMSTRLFRQGINNEQNIPFTHQFICRGQVGNIYPHRQISLPKSIHH